MPQPSDVLDFWFADGMEEKWFLTDPEFDKVLVDKFTDIHTMAKNGELDDWTETLEGRLALVIVLDQFSRNMYRNTKGAFANDEKARTIARRAIKMGDDLWLKKNKPDHWRSFLYVPFIHSENLEDQRMCVNLYLTHGPQSEVIFAYQHMDAIMRFGRFPNRNKALGRTSTPEEEIFLKLGGAGWGNKPEDK